MTQIASDELFLEYAYKVYLGRHPDPTGFEEYRARLAGGVPRGQIVFEISNSEECQARLKKFPGIDKHWPKSPFDFPVSIPEIGLLMRGSSGVRPGEKDGEPQQGAHAGPQTAVDGGIRANGSLPGALNGKSHAAAHAGAPRVEGTGEIHRLPATIARSSALRIDGFSATRRLLKKHRKNVEALMPASDAESLHVAFTIVSNNYFAMAETLAVSFLENHPGHEFIIALVDRADTKVPPKTASGAHVVEIADLAIPGLSTMIYRYSIVELNTAVKPFVAADILQRKNVKTVLYLDPDIYVFRPLKEVYSAFESASIVLIPHIRAPYYDDAAPSELGILRSGTYNLGFLGLKNSKHSRKFLDWWMTKLFVDCVVDIPKGLFVDQKWVDLVPGFFPDHKIIHNPGYNVAYWNLHERSLTATDSESWQVDGLPLVFFHFSGFSPFDPLTLSKHQDRHELKVMEALRRLTDFYGAKLLENEYEYFNSLPYSFETLPNGVSLPLDLVREFMQWAIRNRVKVPDPIEFPQDFCRMLMSKNVVPERPHAVAIYHFLLTMRGDVAQAFPNAVYNTDDEGFQNWLQSSGPNEYKLTDLMKIEQNANLDRVERIFAALRKSSREDVFTAYDRMWISPKVFSGFANWLVSEDGLAAGFDRKDADAMVRAVGGVGKILHIYFLRDDLQQSFPCLGNRETLVGFVAWINSNRYALEVSREEISLFHEFCAARRDLLEEAALLYSQAARAAGGFNSVYSVLANCQHLKLGLSKERALQFAINGLGWNEADQARAYFGQLPESLNDFQQASVPGLDAKKNFEFVRRVRKALVDRDGAGLRANLAGYLLAPTGMGESGRSMAAQLKHHKVALSSLTLPHELSVVESFPVNGNLFGWPKPGSDVSILVANADVARKVSKRLPQSFFGEKSIGYWVWETEEMPKKFAVESSLFDEIWTPSRYSAAAIKKHVTGPVRVVPHTLDFGAIDSASASRSYFSLPNRAVLYGYMFDLRSVLERKNVKGLVEAFERSLRPDDNAFLVIKVNGGSQDVFEYEMIKANVTSERVIFLDGTIDRVSSFGFLKCLDVYVSLHRSEGFGLSCAEAMACAVPVIATGYSGNLDFMNDENSLLVPAKVIETDRPYGPYPGGTRWADPDLEKAGHAMRELLNADRRKMLGNSAAQSVRKILAPAATLPADFLGNKRLDGPQ